MKGDFTRNTFDPNKRYSQVLLQQGRVLLDADFNEQGSILLHQLRTMMADLVGPHGGPINDPGFGITVQSNTKNVITGITIGKGHYYVDGILCENPALVEFSKQPNYPAEANKSKFPAEGKFLFYLLVRERLVTWLGDPNIRESALGNAGPDSAVRAQVEWQVRVADLVGDDLEDITATLQSLREQWQPASEGMLVARAMQGTGKSQVPCTIPPEARFRGMENQLYRVEIHEGGGAAEATFKWSRENGSVVFPLKAPAKQQISLANMGRDNKLDLKVGDWVELEDDSSVSWGEPQPLRRVVEIDPLEMLVTLDQVPTGDVGKDLARNPLLRRWDQRTEAKGPGTIAIKESETDWITLENGVQVQFRPPLAGEAPRQYRAGDYWAIPARTITGDVEWPGTVANPEPRPPSGVHYHLAPLASLAIDNNLKQVGAIAKHRRLFISLLQPTLA